MGYSDHNKAELKELCDKRGIEYADDATNAELRALLDASDEVETVSEVLEEPPKPASGQKQYTVHCDCPTPLAANPFTCLAISESEAVDRFKRRNGIASTDHSITVAAGTE